MPLQRFSWRAMWKRPGRTILTLISIVIGVAAVVAVSITTATTRTAYKQLFATVTGKASLSIDGEGGSSIDQSLADGVAQVPGVQAVVPVVRRYSVLYAGEERVRLQVVGIDPVKDQAVRDIAIAQGRGLQAGKELLMDEALARRLQVRVNDEVRLLTKRGIRPLEIRVVGLIRLEGGTALQQSGLVFMPLPTSQSWFAGDGKIDSIQVVVDARHDPESVEAAIRPLLPAGVRVHPPHAKSQVMKETLASSEHGLRFTTACMLLVAGFIILNTFMMNIGERRRQLSILRAVGATRKQVTRAVIAESLVLGAAGTVLGVGAGLLAASYLNHSLSALLDMQLPAIELSVLPFVLAVIFGFGLSLAGAFVPAWRAGLVSPLEGMDRVPPQDLGRSGQSYIAIGFALIAGASLVIAASIRGIFPTDVAVIAGVVLLTGIVLAAPLFLAHLTRLVVLALVFLPRVETGLALRQILRHRARSALTAGVLFVASSTGVGMSHSILDSVRDVEDWYRQAIVGDFFIRAMLPDMSSGLAADLPDGLVEELRGVPNIGQLDGVSLIESRSGETTFIVVARDMPGEAHLDLVEGDPDEIAGRMREGQIVISSVLAQRLNLRLGDELAVDTIHGQKQLKVCGVANDYLAGGLTVFMWRPTAVELLGVEGYDVFVINTDRAHLAAVQAAVQPLCDKYGVLLHSLSDITGVIDGMVSGIQGCLWGLVVLGFVVAAFGVVNTLTMSVLEQTRELGLLRIVAMTRSQVRRTILVQALIIGVVGFVPGILAGIAVAYVMNLAMTPLLGHPIAFGSHPWFDLATLAGALAITLAAAWIPARRAANLNVLTALHYE